MAAERTAREQAVYNVLLKFGPQRPRGVFKTRIPAGRLPADVIDALPGRTSSATKTLDALVARGDAVRLDTDPVRYAAIKAL